MPSLRVKTTIVQADLCLVSTVDRFGRPGRDETLAWIYGYIDENETPFQYHGRKGLTWGVAGSWRSPMDIGSYGRRSILSQIDAAIPDLPTVDLRGASEDEVQDHLMAMNRKETDRWRRVAHVLTPLEAEAFIIEGGFPHVGERLGVPLNSGWYILDGPRESRRFERFFRDPHPDGSESDTDLAVPFAEKDEARRAGCIFDHDRRIWVAPAGLDPEAFSRWAATDEPRLAPMGTR